MSESRPRVWKIVKGLAVACLALFCVGEVGRRSSIGRREPPNVNSATTGGGASKETSGPPPPSPASPASERDLLRFLPGTAGPMYLVKASVARLPDDLKARSFGGEFCWEPRLAAAFILEADADLSCNLSWNWADECNKPGQTRIDLAGTVACFTTEEKLRPGTKWKPSKANMRWRHCSLDFRLGTFKERQVKEAEAFASAVVQWMNRFFPGGDLPSASALAANDRLVYAAKEEHDNQIEAGRRKSARRKALRELVEAVRESEP